MARKTNARRTRRRLRKKRFSKYRKSTSGGVPRGFASVPFPPSKFMTLTVSSPAFHLLQTSKDIVKTAQFRANSLFDPEYALGGAQPRYYDTLCGADGSNAPYRQYTVLASKIKIMIYQDPTLTGTNGSVAGLVSITPQRGTAGVPISLVDQQEFPLTKTVAVGNANSSKPLVLKHYCKTKNMYAGATKVLSDSDFTANYDANPTNSWLWTLGACNLLDTSTGLFGIYYTVQIKYYVRFSSLNSVLQS